MADKLNIEDLKKSSPDFCRALEHAQKLSTDEIFVVFNELKYKAFGFAAVMVYKMEHNEYWEANLRNDVNWEEPKIDCIGKTVKEAMALMYGWCIHKGYLKISFCIDEVVFSKRQSKQGKIKSIDGNKGYVVYFSDDSYDYEYHYPNEISKI